MNQEEQSVSGGAVFTSLGGFVCQLLLLLGFGDHHGSEGCDKAVAQGQIQGLGLQGLLVLFLGWNTKIFVNDEAKICRSYGQIRFLYISTDIYYWSSLMGMIQLFMCLKLRKCLILCNTGAYVWFKYIKVIDTWSMKYLMDIHIVLLPSYCHFLTYRQYFWVCKNSSTHPYNWDLFHSNVMKNVLHYVFIYVWNGML